MLEPPRALSISGSDNSGCAGLQADLRTWQNLGIHGLAVITAVTAQTADSIPFIQSLGEEALRRQFSTAGRVGFSAGKTGMLGNQDIVELVCSLWEETGGTPLVVDPVLASSSGGRFLEDSVLETLKRRLFPLASVVTPNLPEAEWLLGRRLCEEAEWEDAAREIQSWGVPTVVLKGGHGEETSQIRDLVVDGKETHWLGNPRLETRNSRGTGCVLSAAITAFIARGEKSLDAVVKGREYLQAALSRGYPLNGEPGPCGQF